MSQVPYQQGAALEELQLPCQLLEPRFSELKQSIIKPENRQAVIHSYKRLVKVLASEADRIAKSGPSSIPVIDFADILENGGNLPNGAAEAVRDSGCVVIRNVVSEEVASKWESELKHYVRQHPNVAGFPKHNPQNFSLFWTPPQVQIRSHERVLKAMKAVSMLWHLSSEDALFDLSSQVSYPDRFRIRHPTKDQEYTLNAHQDSGAMERWEDPLYQECYRKIFEGKWEEYDAWNADFRSDAKTDLYGTGMSCSVFRSLQGWISLSHTSTGEGTLRLVPSLKASTAYLMLRPFFVLNEEFDDVTPVFPGATPGDLQFFPTENLHPHLELEKSTVGIPPVKPGDYVFWHCDLIHEVDKFHPGTVDSSVSYNACIPLCPYNLESMIGTRQSFLDVGIPVDFEKYTHGDVEKNHDDNGAKEENILSLEGKRALGLHPFDVHEEGITCGQRKMRAEANRRLGFT
ncbi:hypothetical protein UA08_08360 [Talaromyces atroroseus]|uniref:DUF1479 domain protein n=1 Tax=Talaromyces atroroseus TaxID=1441469 RepID=A0A225ACA3_TALAT|nr:hypothetical protein UA08_08360 [Talaromyces atroroseus]OKL56483.1 hypothetical protein UA08_08360 [Talaromyces atroroseus]